MYNHISLMAITLHNFAENINKYFILLFYKLQAKVY